MTQGMARRIPHIAQRGADMDYGSKKKWGLTPLHRTAVRTTHPAMLEALLENGADPALEDDAGLTPLEFALLAGNIVQISVLLKYRHRLSEAQRARCGANYRLALRRFREQNPPSTASKAKLDFGHIDVPASASADSTVQWSFSISRTLQKTLMPWNEGLYGTRVTQGRSLVPELYATLFEPYFDTAGLSDVGEVVYSVLEKRQVEAVRTGLVDMWNVCDKLACMEWVLDFAKVVEWILEGMVVDNSGEVARKLNLGLGMVEEPMDDGDFEIQGHLIRKITEITDYDEELEELEEAQAADKLSQPAVVEADEDHCRLAWSESEFLGIHKEVGLFLLF